MFRPLSALPNLSPTRSTTRRGSLECTLGWGNGLSRDTLTFTRASGAHVINSHGTLVSLGNDTPRLSFTPLLSYGRGLLVEASRTNMVKDSTDFSTGNWFSTANGTSVTVNVANGPDGTAIADKIVEDNATNAHQIIGSTFAYTTATTYCFSVCARAAERSVIQIVAPASAFGANVWGNFDLAAGTVGSLGSAVTGSGITALGNGWYRCWITGTTTAAVTANSIILGVQTSATATNGQTYAGNGASGLYVIYAQTEVGPNPSSIIVTTAATVTRASDIPFIANTPSTLGYTSGPVTFYVEAEMANVSVANQTVFAITDGTSSNRIDLINSSSTQLQGRVRTGGAYQCFNTAGNIGMGKVFKAAFACATNDTSLSVNGSAVALDNTVTMPTGLTQLSLGYGPSLTSAHGLFIRTLTVWPERLPNETLMALTA